MPRVTQQDCSAKMNTATARLLLDVSFFAVLFGVPFIVLIYPQFPRGNYTFRRRMLTTMFFGWLLFVSLIYFEQELRVLQPWDGDGKVRSDGHLLMYYIGWLPMILGAIPSLVICAIDDYRRKRGLSGLFRPFKEHHAESGPGE